MLKEIERNPVVITASQAALVVKNLPAHAEDVRDVGLIPGSGRCPGEGNGNPLQHSCLENATVRGAWWATVHGVGKSGTQQSLAFSFPFTPSAPLLHLSISVSVFKFKIMKTICQTQNQQFRLRPVSS